MEGQDRRTAWRHRLGAAAVIAAVVTAAYLFPAARGFAAGMAPETIVDEWSSVKPPPPPVLKAVTVDPKTTAYLILDIVRQTCNLQGRPRCVASVPRIAALQARATDAGMLVIATHIPGTTVDDVLAPVKPLPGEPVVMAFTDKFLGTNLDAVLKGANIKTLILAGTSANGAVLTTAEQAALRNYKVVVPVDLMSATTTYAEQYTAWHLTSSPVIPANITLTRSDLIKF